MSFGDPAYGLTRRLAGAFGEIVERTRAALKTEGFGVLTEIDVRATMKAKLDRDHPPYLILGACNPPLAWDALQAEPGIGLLLPCNVVVAQDGASDGAAVVVSAIDPRAMFSVVGRPDVAPLADEVHARLERVLARI